MDKDITFKIFFNWTANAGVTYYRMLNFEKYMKREAGISVASSKYKPLSQGIADWEMWLLDDKKRDQVISDMDNLMSIADISVWQMCHLDLSLPLFLAYRKKHDKVKPVLMDIDDYVFGVNPENIGFDSYYPNSNLEYFAEMQLRNANFVITSTPWLKENLKKYNPCIECIPNAIDFEIWDKVQNYQKEGRVRIGWSGGQAHYEDLKIMMRVMPVILAKYKHVDFVYMGGMPDYMQTGRRIIHVNKWYSMYEYPKQFAKLGIDIGIAPLRDNLFNRAKSNLRYLEYSALKVPTIASPVEPFKNEHFKGYYALEADEWIAMLSRLIEDEYERKRIGQESYEIVKKYYNVENIARNYLSLLIKITKGEIKINK